MKRPLPWKRTDPGRGWGMPMTFKGLLVRLLALHMILPGDDGGEDGMLDDA